MRHRTHNGVLAALAFVLISGLFVSEPTDAGAEITPITPCRLLDSRLDPGAPLAAGIENYLTVRGLCGIPPGATAIMYNATIVSPAGPGFVTLYPGDELRPTASSLNFLAGDIRGNAGFVGLAHSGVAELALYIATSPPGLSSHIVIDVTGYQAGSLVAAAAAATALSETEERWVHEVNGVVNDTVTGLQWETKTDDGTVHDKDDVYTWSATAGGTAADGTAFTSFLATLNAGPCFAGACDWRLPTLDELRTLVDHNSCPHGAAACSGIPGPSSTTPYWTATTKAGDPVSAWRIDIFGPVADYDSKEFTQAVRAVRGGRVPAP